MDDSHGSTREHAVARAFSALTITHILIRRQLALTGASDRRAIETLGDWRFGIADWGFAAAKAWSAGRQMSNKANFAAPGAENDG